MMMIRQPIGVVAMLVPWNFPTAMIARKISAAIAAGCTCTIKPSEDTPLSTLLLAATAQEAGIPPGVINVVTSSRQNAAVVGSVFCNHHDVRGISFTGMHSIITRLLRNVNKPFF
jgi:succinate-semialdehyde dehydrogenase